MKTILKTYISPLFLVVFGMIQYSCQAEKGIDKILYAHESDDDWLYGEWVRVIQQWFDAETEENEIDEDVYYVQDDLYKFCRDSVYIGSYSRASYGLWKEVCKYRVSNDTLFIERSNPFFEDGDYVEEWFLDKNEKRIVWTKPIERGEIYAHCIKSDRQVKIDEKLTEKYKGKYQFHEGLATFEQDGKYGFINPYGDIEIYPIYDWCEPFINGFAKVSLDGEERYINKKGEEIFQILDGVWKCPYVERADKYLIFNGEDRTLDEEFSYWDRFHYEFVSFDGFHFLFRYISGNVTYASEVIYHLPAFFESIYERDTSRDRANGRSRLEREQDYSWLYEGKWVARDQGDLFVYSFNPDGSCVCYYEIVMFGASAYKYGRYTIKDGGIYTYMEGDEIFSEPGFLAHIEGRSLTYNGGSFEHIY